MKRLLPLLSDFIPDHLAEKGLSKISPKIKSFLSNSAKSGIGTGAALSFLRNSFKDPAVETENARLKQGIKSQTLRPDEKVSARDRSDQEKKEGILTKVATLGAGALGGVGVLGSLGGLLGSESQDQSNNPQQSKSQSPSTLSRSAMEEDIRSQNAQPEQSQQKFDSDFPQLTKVTIEAIESGIDPESIYEKLKSSKFYTGLVRKFEQASGMSFLDKIYELAGGSRPQQQNGQGQSSAGKQQFLAGLNQMSQILQGLKR